MHGPLTEAQFEVVNSGLAEMRLIAANPSLQTVPFTLRGVTTVVPALRPDGLLTTHAIRRAAAAGRMPHFEAIARYFPSEGRGSRPGRSMEPFLQALSLAAGVEAPLEARTMTVERVLQLAVAEVRLIQSDPALEKVPRRDRPDATPLSALTADGLLTVAGLDRAAAEGRMPSHRVIIRLFPPAKAASPAHRSRANSLRSFQEALARQLSIEIPDWSSWSAEQMIDAGVALVERLRAGDGSHGLLDDGGRLTTASIKAASLRGELPPSDRIAATVTSSEYEGVRSLMPFITAVASRMGLGAAKTHWTHAEVLQAAKSETEQVLRDPSTAQLTGPQRLLDADGVLTAAAVERAAKYNRMPSLRTVTAMFSEGKPTMSYRWFKQALRTELGLAPGRTVWTSREQVFEATIKEALRLRRSTTDRWVAGTGRGGALRWYRTLSESGLLTQHGYKKASHEGRLPDLTVIERMFRTEVQTGFAALNKAVSVRLGEMERLGHLRPIVDATSPTLDRSPGSLEL